MTLIEAQAIVADCSYEGYTIELIRGSMYDYIQARYMEADTISGKVEEQKTRRWVLDATDYGPVTKDQLVQTAFKCVLTSMEHKAREGFHYKGRAIFMPHFSVDDLWNLNYINEG